MPRIKTGTSFRPAPVGDQRAWHRNHGFLDELFEMPQGTKCGPRVDRPNPTWMTVPQAFRRSSASGPRTSPIGMRSGRRRKEERTRSESDTTPSFVRRATRFGAWH